MREPAQPDKVGEAVPLHLVMPGCPALVIVLYDARKRAPASEGDVLGLMSLGCVLENMWLMAHSLGIGFQALSVLSSPAVEEAVKNPWPLTVEEMSDALAEATGRRLIKVPLPRNLAKASLAHVPGLYRLMRIPPEAVDYFAHPTFYLTDHCRADLAGSGIEAPSFRSYVDQLVEYMRSHREIGSAAMF